MSGRERRGGGCGASIFCRGHCRLGRRMQRVASGGQRQENCKFPIETDKEEVLHMRRCRDRKSTRLNSSHVD